MARAVKKDPQRTGPLPATSHETPTASYLGSQEHKPYPSPLGQPMPRSDASKCPTDIPYPVAREALSSAIRASISDGCHSKLMEGAFPRYVWGKVRAGSPQRDIYFEARLTNRQTGQYKAWPIDETHENDHLTEPIRQRIWPL